MASPPSPPKHRYGSGPSQFGELLRPHGAGPHPVAVVIHGGFWRAVHGRQLTWPVCGDLVRRGWAVWNLEYRRVGLGLDGGWPATLDDVRDGVAHLAALDDLDLDRVVTIGHSAGGQLAVWAATQDARVRGAVSLAGILDLTAACDAEGVRGPVEQLLGGTPEEVPDRLAAASPAALVPIGVPVLCLHGALDATVPLTISESFAEKARLAGDEIELHVFDGEDHMGALDPRNVMWRAAATWIERFRS